MAAIAPARTDNRHLFVVVDGRIEKDLAPVRFSACSQADAEKVESVVKTILDEIPASLSLAAAPENKRARTDKKPEIGLNPMIMLRDGTTLPISCMMIYRDLQVIFRTDPNVIRELHAKCLDPKAALSSASIRILESYLLIEPAEDKSEVVEDDSKERATSEHVSVSEKVAAIVTNAYRKVGETWKIVNPLQVSEETYVNLRAVSSD